MESFEQLNPEAEEDEVAIEIEEVNQGEQSTNHVLCLVGRFLTNKAIHIYMRENMHEIWYLVRKVKIERDHFKFINL
jgi:hypothetical protein